MNFLKNTISTQIAVASGVTLLSGIAALVYSHDQVKSKSNKILKKGKEYVSKLVSQTKSTNDKIDKEIEDSFPASDPPSWSGMVVGANR